MTLYARQPNGLRIRTKRLEGSTRHSPVSNILEFESTVCPVNSQAGYYMMLKTAEPLTLINVGNVIETIRVHDDYRDSIRQVGGI